MPRSSGSSKALAIYEHDLPRCLVDILFGKELACDTETDGLEFRRDKLRLVQIATRDGDVFAVRNPDAKSKNLRLILEKADIVIFHNAAFDLKFLMWWTGTCLFSERVRCTKTLGKMLGYEASGLASLLKEVLDIKLPNKDRKISKSDWNAKGLSTEQKLYASNDVLYLHRLHDELLARWNRKKCFTFQQAIYPRMMRSICEVAWLEKIGYADILSYDAKPNMTLRKLYKERSKSILLDYTSVLADKFNKGNI